MIQLSIEKINAQSPYEFSYAPNGDFVFVTSLGPSAISPQPSYISHLTSAIFHLTSSIFIIRRIETAFVAFFSLMLFMSIFVSHEGYKIREIQHSKMYF